MVLFALLVALVFGVVGREGESGRLRYGFALAWLLYFVPW
jgi:hypothetical protein